MSLTTTVITGATSGIGKETALALARKGHTLYLLVRNTKKGEQVKQEIISATKNKDIHVIYCDLADLQTVREAADVLKGKLIAINVLINNAGGIFAQKEMSGNGHEMTFATNHLGHFLLVNALLPLLEKGQARIINVSSEAHRIGKPRFADLNWNNAKYSAMSAYASVKLYNILFARSLAAKYRLKGITAFALHPGIVKTEFGSQLTGFSEVLMLLARPFMITPEKGAQTTIYLATEPRIDTKNGKYFKNKRAVSPAAIAMDDGLRDQLWNISADMITSYSSNKF